MLFSILLAFSLSIDALGIGFSYGLRGISFPTTSKILLSLETMCMLFVYLFVGKGLARLLPTAIGETLGTGFLLLFGLWLIGKAFAKNKDTSLSALQQPSICDKDSSSSLEPRETLLLGFILSLDSFGVGISATMSGMHITILPVFSALFQIAFLSIGAMVGNRLSAKTQMQESLWSCISGGILIVIGFIRLFLA